MSQSFFKTIGAALAGVAMLACGNSADTGLTQRLSKANEDVVEAKRQITRLEAENKGLKRQLAEAMANPSKLVLNDPEIIELIASIRGGQGAAGQEITIGKGDLNPKEASKIVMRGAQALQQCYERALKKNQALQYNKGVRLTLGLTVKATGDVAGVAVDPVVDSGLTACIDGAAKRWKFPKFAGEAVTVEQRIMLTPKT